MHASIRSERKMLLLLTVMKGTRVTEVPYCDGLRRTPDGVYVAEVTLPTLDQMRIAYSGLRTVVSDLWHGGYDTQLLDRINAARHYIYTALESGYPGVVLHSGQSMHVHTVAGALGDIRELQRDPLGQPVPYEGYVAAAARPVYGEAARYLYVPMPTLIEGDSIPLPPNVDRLSIPAEDVSRIIRSSSTEV
jgi:hypothetical protein